MIARGFTPLDWAVVGAYLLTMLATGVYFARRQRSTEEFLLAGRRIPVWAAAISIVAASVSAATFLGAPEQAYSGNLAYLSTNIAALIAVLIVAVVFIPAFYRENVSTVYQFLGRRFGPNAARSASTAFVLGRLLASGARLYMAAIPVSLIIWGDLDPTHLILAVSVLTVVSIAYTLLGGLSAVIWTEVPQALLFVTAAIVAIGTLLSMIPAPLDAIMTALRESIGPSGTSKLTVLDTRWDPTTDFSVWSSLIGLTLFNMAVYAADQDLAQRMLSCKTAVKGAWSAILSNFIGIGVAVLFLAVGLLLWVFYTRPDLMGGEAAVRPEDSRQVFLDFILGHMPPGLRGLMLAGLFAAAMSSIASTVGAIASTLITDFYRQLRPNLPEAKYVRASRLSVLVSGLLLGLVACVCVVWQDTVRKELLPFALGVMLFAYTGLMAVFLAAVMTRRGNAASVACALIAGAVCVALMQFGPALKHPIFRVPAFDGTMRPLSLGWQMTIGTAVAFVVCIIPPRRPLPIPDPNPNSIPPIPNPQSEIRNAH